MITDWRARGVLGIPGLNPVALAIGLAWVVIVLLSWWYTQSTGRRVPLCLFRNLTGLPCPTCGGTRAAMSLATGAPAAALRFNPLVTAFLLVAPLWVAWRFVRRNRPRQPSSAKARAWAGGLALAALAVNWAYVLWNDL